MCVYEWVQKKALVEGQRYTGASVAAKGQGVWWRLGGHSQGADVRVQAVDGVCRVCVCVCEREREKSGSE